MVGTVELFNRKLRWHMHALPSIDCGRRKNHSATLVGGRVYLCCGYVVQNASNLNDVTVLEERTNKRQKKKFVLHEVQLSDPLRPSPRNGHTTNLVGDKLFLFGGWGGHHALSDVWMFDLVLRCWSKPHIRGKPHPMLNMHVSEYIDWMNCILCFGGGDGQQFENSVTCLFMKTLEWKKLTPKGNAPLEAANIGACLVNSTYYVFGGWNPQKTFHDIHLLHLPKTLSKPSWSTPELGQVPPQRVGAGMADFYGRVLMFGGQYGNHYYDLWLYDIQEQKWYDTRHNSALRWSKGSGVIEVSGSWPVGRVGHTVTIMPSGSLLVYGGSGSGGIPGFCHTLELAKI